jgi:hypothetical protein
MPGLGGRGPPPARRRARASHQGSELRILSGSLPPGAPIHLTFQHGRTAAIGQAPLECGDDAAAPGECLLNGVTGH